MSGKQRTVFNASLQKDFKFLKAVQNDPHSVLCKICNSSFSIGNGGRSDIKAHERTGKHAKNAKAVSNARPISSLLVDQQTPALMQLQTQEITFAFHTGKHRLSGSTATCTSNLIKKCFEPKFSSSATKTSKIIQQVISPAIEGDVAKCLDKMTFVAVITDCSNRKADKMLPVMVRGFDEESGVKTFKLAVNFIPNERSETIVNEIVETGTRWHVLQKINAFAGDNCNTNFGGANRNGENNVFYRLKQTLHRSIAGVGCTCHIIHNAADSACDQLPISIESLIVVIYKYFNLHTIRVEALKELCSEMEVEYTKLVKHSGTRFLTLHPAIVKVRKVFS